MNHHALAALLAGTVSLLPVSASAGDIDDLRKAAEWGKTAMGAECDFPEFESGDGIAENNRIHRFDFKYEYDTDADAAHVFTLYELHCMSGAYNVGNIYVTLSWDNKYQLLSFAEPSLDIRYKDAETMTELMGAPRVTGYRATSILINSSFDPATKTITSRSNWRGLGDAWSSGTWTFDDGQFILTGYDVDPVYDLNGENANQDEERPQDIFRILP
jgi:hypothetical protein